jgi:hypothetical protein
MIMKCDYQNLIPEFLTNGLEDSDRDSFVEHLGVCQSCADTLHSFRGVDSLLQALDRPEPRPELLARYYAGLDEHFGEGFLTKFSKAAAEYWHSQTRSIRLLRAGTVIAFGVLIGWFIFGSEQRQEIAVPIQPSHGLRLANQDVLLVREFFTETESVLQDVVSTSQRELREESMLDQKKRAAQSLLIRTFVIHELALQLQNDSILEFLTRLELVLYEVSNLTDEELDESLGAIQLLIRESGLLQQAVHFKQLV